MCVCDIYLASLLGSSKGLPRVKLLFGRCLRNLVGSYGTSLCLAAWRPHRTTARQKPRSYNRLPSKPPTRSTNVHLCWVVSVVSFPSGIS
eukprot:1037633-Amphidinium_carterae.1